MNGIIRKTSIGAVAVSGERRATATAIADFSVPDFDHMSYHPRAFDGSPAAFPMYRDHSWHAGSGASPFAVATWQSGRQLDLDIEFLPTQRGEEEYLAAKALAAKGATQKISIAFRVISTGPVPDELKAKGSKTHVTKAELLEASFVLVGAIPGAQVTSVKCNACAPKQPDPADIAATLRESERLLREGARLRDRPLTKAEKVQFEHERASFTAQFGRTEGVGVHPDKRRLGEAVAAWAAERWGIKAPAVKFVSVLPNPSWGGFWSAADPNAVHIKSDLAGWGLVRVVIHEVTHHARDVHRLSQAETEVEADTCALLKTFASENTRWLPL
jgi:hypothetical protein